MALTHPELEEILADATAPLAFVDLDALWANAASLLARTSPAKPIRLASKSLRCREIMDRVLGSDDRFRGVLAFTLPEALWLHDHGHHDVVVAYPSVDREAIEELARRDPLTRPIPMIDCPEHLDLIESVGPDAPVDVCLDLDAGLRLLGGRVHVGPKRSPVYSVTEAVELAREVRRRPGVRLVGLMGYEGQVAGVGDAAAGPLRNGVIRAMQSRSVDEVRTRRGEIVAAVREVAELRFVNGGGTGSLETTSADASVTEVTAGSGFYAPHLFDGYRHLELTPAAGFALPVVRRHGPGSVTVLGGGYPASGPAEESRLPQPWLPAGLRFDPNEGAGEVQTPLFGEAAASLSVGSLVFFRHAKAGELCERFPALHLIEGGTLTGVVPTYRGEGMCFL